MLEFGRGGYNKGKIEGNFFEKSEKRRLTDKV